MRSVNKKPTLIQRSCIALLTAALLTLTACSEAPQDVQVFNPDKESAESTPSQPEESTPDTEAAEDTAPIEETDNSETTTEDTEAEEITTEETTTETTAEKTTPPETTPVTTTAAPETTPGTTAAPADPWTETAVSGVMYINADGIFSRAQAIQGSTKVQQYSLNQAVNVVARTDTDYYKLDTGAFIHSAYLSSGKTAITTTAAITTAAPVTTAAPPATTTAAPEPAAPSGGYGQRAQMQWEKDFANEVFELTNKIREENGLSPFGKMTDVTEIAVTRAWEISVAYNSDHTRPNGSTCYTAFDEHKLYYGVFGENIAAGQGTPQEVVDAWMNSPPHRASILDPAFTIMGVGFYYVEGGDLDAGYYWTQEFFTPY